jgi:hypothetical protein
VARAKVAALVKESQVEIDREAARQHALVLQAGLTSDQARAFVAAIPTPDALLAPLGSLKLRGETILLADPVTAVMAGGPDETANRNGCAFCGRALASIRSDSRYCSARCRVADYRRRQAATPPAGATNSESKST